MRHVSDPRVLPTHAEALAARFGDELDGVKGTLASGLTAVGRADLLPISARENTRHGARINNNL